MILNGLGTTKYEELFVVWRTVARLLRAAGYTVVDPEVGERATRLDMSGCSLTVVHLDDEVPTHGVSVGLGTIRDLSRSVRLVLLGSGKRTAAGRVLAATDFEPDWPATFIHRCRDARVLIDEAARPDGFEEALGHDPSMEHRGGNMTRRPTGRADASPRSRRARSSRRPWQRPSHQSPRRTRARRRAGPSPSRCGSTPRSAAQAFP